MKKQAFLFATAAALLVAFAVNLALGQETTAAKPVGEAEASPNGPPFVASLILIKADWSELPAAKEIEADLRKALAGETISEDLLKTLPASGPAILFPVEMAAIYSKDHFAQFVTWLDSKGIILKVLPFQEEKVQMRTRTNFGPGEPYQIATAQLTKDLEFLGLSSTAPSGDQPFITRTTELSWNVQNHKTGLLVQRSLSAREKARGQAETNHQIVESCGFKAKMLTDGQVFIAPAFPSSQDGTLRYAAKNMGFDALLVIEQHAPEAATKADPRFLLPDKIERLAVERTQNAGMSLVGQSLSFTRPPGGSVSRFVTSGNIMISWSEKKDVAWGFSKSLGTWVKQELNPPATERGPMLDDKIAVWMTGSKYYGYSGETGRWDVLRLPEGHSPPPILDSGLARIHDGDEVFTFAASTGRWSSPKGSEAAATAKTDEAVIKVFTLQHTKATDAERLIAQLFARKIQSVAADERTNSVVVSGTSDDLNIIHHILLRLDEPLDRDSKSQTSIAPPRSEAASSGSVATLTRLYGGHEQNAVALAQKIRELQSDKSADPRQLEKLSAALRDAVSRAFAARQQLHQAEAAQLQQRIASIQKNLQTRERLSEQIIEQRVKDLIDHELKWDAAAKKLPATVPSSAFTERAELFAKLHDDPKWIENAKDDFRRASSSQERKSALDVELSWRRDIVKALLRLRQLGEQVDADLAAAEAEIQRTETKLREQEADPARPINTIPTTNESVVIRPAASVRDSTADSTEKLTDKESDTIWNVLGVKVRAVTAEELSVERYAGGAVVTEVRPGGPTDGMAPLRKNDIIVRMDSWEVTSPQRLAFILTQTFTHREWNGDKLLSIVEVLRGKGDRRAMVQNSIEFPAESIVKPPPVASSPAAQPASAAGTVLGGSRQISQIRSAEEFRRRLQAMEDLVQLGKTTLASKFTAEGEEEKTKVLQQQHDRNQRELAFLREEYGAQLRLLQLEIQDAKSALEAASQQRDLAQKQFAKDKGVIPRESALSFERAVEEARLRLDRAETLLHLYRKADPKQAEPEKLKPT